MVYRACRTLKHNGREWRPGEEVPADVFTPELLRRLLNVAHLRVDREGPGVVAVKVRPTTAAPKKKGGRPPKKEGS